MNFFPHFDLQGKHAFLSASKYAWIRYDDDKLIETVQTSQNAALGSELHAFASTAIKLKIKQARTTKTLNMFINDVLGFHMESEQVLYYSANIFGTADAISFKEDKKTGLMLLRIFDLKTGTTKASFDQLLIYAAMFCHEYKVDPRDINIELRIYQNDEVKILEPLLEDVTEIMDKMERFDKLIEDVKQEMANSW